MWEKGNSVSGFDERNDGADRCSAFVASLAALMREHRVKLTGTFSDLQKCNLEHDDGENGWLLDMQDIQMLTDGKSR